MTLAVRRWAIVPAAGQGSRFGAALPKQYTPLLGRPMLSWTLATLLAEPRIDGIVVSLAQGDTHWQDLPEFSNARVRRCTGGTRREHSVVNGLGALDGDARDTDWVLVHDAARPCLRRRDLETDQSYNTYTRYGLPPTPIAMPGEASIQATVNPAKSPVLYFVARGDGSHEFSSTLAEHNRAVNKYQRSP